MYRFDTGKLRELGASFVGDSIRPFFADRYKEYVSGVKKVCCGLPSGTKPPDPETFGEQIKVTYLGALGKHHVRGSVTGTNYGRRQNGDTFYIYTKDYEPLAGLFQPVEEIALEPEKQPIPADL